VRPAQRKRFVMATPIARLFVVDGGAIRTHRDVDFIGGGHHLVYPWIPPGEAWIEQALGDDGRFIAVHELAEIHQMLTRGWSYEKAHAFANRIEAGARRWGSLDGAPMPFVLRRVLRDWSRSLP
jgi:hypothetical protein